MYSYLDFRVCKFHFRCSFLDRKIIFLGGGGVNDPLLIRGLAVIPKMGVTGLVNRCSPSPSDVMEKEGGVGGTEG